MLALAAPLVLAQLAQISLGFIDTVMVGRLGSEALAAVALGSASFFPLMVIGMGVLTAVSPMVSQAYGAGRPHEAGRAARQGLWLTVVLAVPAVLLLRHAESFLRLTGQEEPVIQLAQGYLRAISWGFLPAIGFSALRNFVEGFSRPRPVMMIAFLGVGCNVLANYVLMFGALGFPALGLTGTGWASTIVYWTMFLALGAYIRYAPVFRPYAVFNRLGRPDWTVFRELLRIGLPAGALWGVEAGLFAATAFLMGTLGATVLAAHQIAIQCASFTFMVPLGLSMATAVRVGQAVGRGDAAGIHRAGFTGMAIGTAFMLLAALAFWIFPRRVVSLYLDVSDPANAGVIRIAVTLLGIAAVFQVFDGLQATASGALRGLKDTRVPMFVGLVSYWLIGLTTGYELAFVLGWGEQGLWWGLVIGLAVAAVLLPLRFHAMTRAGTVRV